MLRRIMHLLQTLLVLRLLPMARTTSKRGSPIWPRILRGATWDTLQKT